MADLVAFQQDVRDFVRQETFWVDASFPPKWRAVMRRFRELHHTTWRLPQDPARGTYDVIVAPPTATILTLIEAAQNESYGDRDWEVRELLQEMAATVLRYRACPYPIVTGGDQISWAARQEDIPLLFPPSVVDMIRDYLAGLRNAGRAFVSKPVRYWRMLIRLRNAVDYETRFARIVAASHRIAANRLRKVWHLDQLSASAFDAVRKQAQLETAVHDDRLRLIRRSELLEIQRARITAQKDRFSKRRTTVEGRNGGRPQPHPRPESPQE